MRRLAAAACVVLALLAVCATLYLFLFAPDYSARLLYSLGNRAESKGSLPRAEYFYEQSLLFDPYDAKARLALTSLMLRQHKSTRAEELLREGIDLSPSNASYYTQLSSLLVGQNRLDEAVQCLDDASGGYAGLRLGPQRPVFSASPAPGSYDRPVTFAIDAQAGTAYYYTLDGSVPSLSSAVYDGPLSLNASTRYTIRVIALGKNGLPSRMQEYVYDLRGYRPEAAAAGGDGEIAEYDCPYCGKSFGVLIR